MGPLLAYPGLESVPGPVDLVVVAVPKERVPEALEAAGRRGARGAIVLTTGFTPKEAQALADKARRLGMRLLGPGSLGLVHTHPGVRLAAGLAPLPKEGVLAISSQSGTLGRAVLAFAEEMGLGVASFVSLGAKADISSNDLLQFWEEDERTRVILLYLEHFGNPRRFSRLARRIGKKSPSWRSTPPATPWSGPSSPRRGWCGPTAWRRPLTWPSFWPRAPYRRTGGCASSPTPPAPPTWPSRP